MSFTYPKLRRDETVIDEYFDTKVADPYRWLEDPDFEETKNFVKAQNEITKPYIDSCPFKQSLQSRITKLWNFPKCSSPAKHGNRYYQYRNTGLQNQSILFVQQNLKDEGTVFLDPNLFSKDGTVALSGTRFSKDGSTLAYGLSASGSDWIDIRFKDTKTGTDYSETLKKVKYSSMSWMHDNNGFFYGGYLTQIGKADGSETTSSEYHKLYYHYLGTDQSEDVVAVDFEDKELRMSAVVSDCGKYLLILPVKGCKNNLVYFTKVDPHQKISKKLELTPLVTVFEADYEYITNLGSKFYFRTNKDAMNYKIVVVDLDNPSEWTDLIEENPNDVLDIVHAINTNMAVVCYLKDCKHTMHIFDLVNGEKIHDIKLDVGTVHNITGESKSTELFYSFCSFLTPVTIYRVKFSGGDILEKLYHQTIVGELDPSLFETNQVFYNSKDGERVPMFIISKKGFVKDSSRPCLLYGYGGFNINLTPAFSISPLVFINSFNGIYALANIRGGGEYGDKWHNAGRLESKQNTFDDFQHAARFLVSEKYTTADKLTIQGGSNGGLLVAACINQAPELFGAAICQVGVLDMLRFHKFTIGYAWKSDYGCSEEEQHFHNLYSFSPLHNIKPPSSESIQYPATLLVTADHDDRVVPLHSFKFIAELQYRIGSLPQQKNPLMILVETKAGHGAGKPLAKMIEEMTDIFCFISNSLGLKFCDNKD